MSGCSWRMLFEKNLSTSSSADLLFGYAKCPIIIIGQNISV